MNKRKKDMITAETARKVKSMSLPELNTYLYAIYLSGYNEGYKAGYDDGDGDHQPRHIAPC